MSMKKDQRFIRTEMRTSLMTSVFPPEEILYVDTKLMLLGTSNKADLISTYSGWERYPGKDINQFVYTDKDGNIYEACLYKESSGIVHMWGLRSRQLPDKPRKTRVKKEDPEDNSEQEE